MHLEHGVSAQSFTHDSRASVMVSLPRGLINHYIALTRKSIIEQPYHPGCVHLLCCIRSPTCTAIASLCAGAPMPPRPATNWDRDAQVNFLPIFSPRRYSRVHGRPLSLTVCGPSVNRETAWLGSELGANVNIHVHIKNGFWPAHWSLRVIILYIVCQGGRGIAMSRVLRPKNLSVGCLDATPLIRSQPLPFPSAQ